MKRILINASQPEELRVAIVDGQKLNDLDIEVPSSKQRKANVYKGRITRVEPSLEAAFVDYGSERHGFLPLKEISRSYFKEGTGNSGRVNIKDVIKEGQEVIVQVDKEERGNKGAALTTILSLAGRYLVLMPNNSRAGGVSRRIEGEDRNELREAMAKLEMPQGIGVIARTAGVGRSTEELQWDLDYLTQLWAAIEKAASERSAPFLIYQEGNVVIRALRDYLRKDVGEIIIDDAKAFAQAQDFMQQVMPANLSKLIRYEDTIPLFSRFQIESQIESAFRRTVQLPSGGSVVLDHTEALLSIDINSSRSTGGADIEETALNTNLEAADEIARQLRLRDMGGLIVIDFIDMSSSKAQRQVEDCLRDAVAIDRARIQIGRISRFGLLEMSRQRLRPSLGDHSHEVCPRCSGQGTIRNVESLSLSVLRLVEEEALKDRTSRVIAHLPVSVASFLLNEKRSILSELETRCKTHLTIVPNQALETPHYEVRRIRDDQLAEDDNGAHSHLLTSELSTTTDVEIITDRTRPLVPEEAAVRQVMPATQAPTATAAKIEAAPRRPGLAQRLILAIKAIFATNRAEPEPENKKKTNQSRGQGNRQNQQRNRNNNRNQQNRNNNNRRRNQQRKDDDEKGTQQNQGKQNQNRKQQPKQNRDASGNRPNQANRKQNQPRKTANEDNGKNPTATSTTANAQQENAEVTSQQSTGPQSSNQAGGEDNNRRRRGRRGGRRNRRSQGEESQNSNQNTAGENNQPAAEQRPAQTGNAVSKPAEANSPAVNVPAADQRQAPATSEINKPGGDINPPAGKVEPTRPPQPAPNREKPPAPSLSNTPSLPASENNAPIIVQTSAPKPPPTPAEKSEVPKPAPSTGNTAVAADSGTAKSEAQKIESVKPVFNETKAAVPANPSGKPEASKPSLVQVETQTSNSKPQVEKAETKSPESTVKE